MAGKDLEIRCPECGVRIRLDPHSGQVIAHGQEERAKDLGEAARRHADKSSGKDAAFRSALEAEKGRKQELNDLFKKASEKARQEKDETRPDRPLDDRWR